MKTETQVEEFCRRHHACQDGREWATANCQTMREVWTTARPDWLVWVATRPGVLTDRELRLFAVHCARQALALVGTPDPRSLEAVAVTERHANGQATDAELAAARSAAAADAAYYAAARSAAYAARSATAAALSAALSAARAAAADALSAALSATRAAARAAEKKQAEYLRVNCNPTF